MWRIVLAVFLAATWATSTAYAADETAHSGRLVAVSDHELTLEVMGPWAPHHTTVHRLSVAVTAATKIERVARTTKAVAGAWAGSFASTPLAVSDLHPGDYATVKVSQEGHRLVADSIVVMARTPEVGPTA